jgi:malate dehydrogenase
MAFRRPKIALIGGGQIGGIMAFTCAQRELGDVVMLDIMPNVPQGKCLDMTEGTPVFGSDSRVKGTNSYEDCAGADVVIVTAGVPRKPGMTRADLLDVNVKAMQNVAENIKRVAPNAFHIIITNPLDAMVYTYAQVTGAPKHMVAGMAGVLDAARYQAFISLETGFSAKDVTAMVLGGHGPDMVPLRRYTTINGLPVELFIDSARLDEIEKRTREAGTEIVNLMGGSAFFSPAISAVSMAEAYLKDQKRLQCAAVWVEGQYGFKEMFIGLPCIIGGNGVEKVIELPLNEAEKAALATSHTSVSGLVAEAKARLA